ncbi:Hypothetical_protein [Hexamita inflata]|uniref:Hypothetical_protein n=1 Tax=Hexamita inflata TaxID=28002 RepID=A0ABP1GHB0_9EUKA
MLIEPQLQLYIHILCNTINYKALYYTFSSKFIEIVQQFATSVLDINGQIQIKENDQAWRPTLELKRHCWNTSFVQCDRLVVKPDWRKEQYDPTIGVRTQYVIYNQQRKYWICREPRCSSSTWSIQTIFGISQSRKTMEDFFFQSQPGAQDEVLVLRLVRIIIQVVTVYPTHLTFAGSPLRASKVCSFILKKRLQKNESMLKKIFNYYLNIQIQFSLFHFQYQDNVSLLSYQLNSLYIAKSLEFYNRLKTGVELYKYLFLLQYRFNLQLSTLLS